MQDMSGPETEDEGKRYEALRRLRVRRAFKAQVDQTQDSTKSQKTTPESEE